MNLERMKISLLKLRKNTRYNYTPRYYSGKNGGNPYDFDSKFSKYRNTYNQNDYGHQWQEARIKMRSRSNRGISSRLVTIIIMLILAFLYIIDFDLSIFSA